MRVRFLACAFLLAVGALGCASVQTVEPRRFIPKHKPESVSVWTTATDVTIVSDPQLSGDTLAGVVLEERWALPLKDILRVEAEAPDRTRTAILITGVAAAVAGLGVLIGGPRPLVVRAVCTDAHDVAC